MESDFDSHQAQQILLFSRESRHSGAHPASYSMGTSSSSLGVQWLGEDLRPSCKFHDQNCVEMYLHSPVHLYATAFI
jgi:hypothetical protein